MLPLFIIIILFFKMCHAHPLLTPGKCQSNVWRKDDDASLPGRCVGINSHIEFQDLKNIKVSNWRQCRSLCCNLNERCTTWQYQNSSNICYIHKRPYRRGPEGSDTVMYCDPNPTHKWNGKMLQSRNNGICKWAYDIPRQCFSFGPERRNENGIITYDTNKGRRMNDKECEDACCKDSECNSWQEYSNIGCFYGKSNCEYEEVEGVYEGGRKCLPGFCGGKEKEILLHDQMEKLKIFVETLKIE